MKSQSFGVKEASGIKEEKGLSLNRLLKQIIMYAPGSIIPVVMGLLSAAVFTRIFSTSEYGQYNLVLSITALITAIFSQWLQQAINRFIPAKEKADEQIKLKYIIVSSLGLIGVLIISLVLIIIPFLFQKVPSDWKPFFLPGILLILGMSLFNPLSVVLQAEMRAREYTFYTVCNSILKVLLSIAFVFVVIKQAQGLVWGAAVSALLMIPLLWRKARLPSPLVVFKEGINKSLWMGIREFAVYGLPMIGWFISSNILSVGDRYVIQWFRGAAEVGIYSANYTLITGAISLLTAPVLLAAHPFLMKSWSIGDKEQTGKWLGSITEWFMTAGVILVGFIWLFSEDLARLLLGPEFRQGHVIMPVVIAGAIMWQLGVYAHKPLEFVKRTRLLMFMSIAAAILNLIMNVILVPLYGYLAAAYTTFLSYLFYNIVAIIAGQRIIKWQIRWKRLLANILITSFGVSLIFSIRIIIQKWFGNTGGLLITLTFYIFLAIIVLYQYRFKGKYTS